MADIIDELFWEFYRPRDLGNRRMGASPVTHLTVEGVDIPEGHAFRQYPTRKGSKPPTSPRYKARPLLRGMQPIHKSVGLTQQEWDSLWEEDDES